MTGTNGPETGAGVAVCILAPHGPNHFPRVNQWSPEMSMTNRMMVWLCLAFAMTSTPALCREKPVQDCKVTFAVVYLDRLNNTNNGIPAKSVKDVEKRLSKYGDVCYAGDKQADLL
jgi:hypothetical protein